MLHSISSIVILSLHNSCLVVMEIFIMSIFKPDLGIGNNTSSEEVQSKREKQQPKETSFSQELKLQIKSSSLSTFKSLLIIIRVTLIFISVLLADALIQIIISWSFSGMVNHSFFAAELFKGIQLLSGLGTAAAYGLRLIQDLSKDVKLTAKVIREGGIQEEVEL